jgi:16S rRNA (guanine527-N7)-methyltransferase
MGAMPPVQPAWQIQLDRGLAQLGLDLSAVQRERLRRYITLLERWNRTFNLTAVRDPRDMIAWHLMDSLSLCPHLHGERLLDVGTGAGLPGLPLAVANPARSFVLLDSSGKKTRFVMQAVLALGLDNVEVVTTRIESYRPAEKFATIVSRALTSTARLFAMTSPLLARPGYLLVMKGQRPDAELAELGLAAEAWRLRLHHLRVPLLNAERHLIEIVLH